MKNTQKTSEKTPGSILYRVDVYEKNQIGICKGYFNSYMIALFESEHDIIVSELVDMQAHTQITMVYIEPNGQETNVENYYFI
jgi:hypothetical protein